MTDYGFTVAIGKHKDGLYLTLMPNLQGCYAQADMYEESLDNAKDAICPYIEAP